MLWTSRGMDTSSTEKEKIPEKLAQDLCLEGESQDLGSDERLLRRGRKRNHWIIVERRRGVG